MALKVRKRRQTLPHHYEGDRPVLSALVTEEQTDGDLKIHFAGLTGGFSAKGAAVLLTGDRLRQVFGPDIL